MPALFAVSIHTGVTHWDALCRVTADGLRVSPALDAADGRADGVAVVRAGSAAEAVRSAVTGSATVNTSILGPGWADLTHGFPGGAFRVDSDDFYGYWIGLDDTAGGPWADGDYNDSYWGVAVDEVAEVSVAAAAGAAEAGADARSVTPGRFVVSRTGPVGQPLTVSVAFPTALPTPAGQARLGDDFTAATAVTFAAGSATADLDITPVKDNLVEGAEQVRVSVSAPASGYAYRPAPGSAPAAQLALADDPPILVAELVENAAEGVHTGLVTLAKPSGGAPEDLTVVVELGGTATPGVDYAPPGAPAPGAADPLRWRVVSVPYGSAGGVPLAFEVYEDDDEGEEGDETITVTTYVPSAAINFPGVVGAAVSLTAYNIAQPPRPEAKVEEEVQREEVWEGELDIDKMFTPTAQELKADPYNYEQVPNFGKTYFQPKNRPLPGAGAFTKHLYWSGTPNSREYRARAWASRPDAAGAVKVEASAYFPADGYLKTEWNNIKSFVHNNVLDISTPAKLRLFKALLLHEDLHWQIQSRAYFLAQKRLKVNPRPLAYAAIDVPAGGDVARAKQLALKEVTIKRTEEMAKLRNTFLPVVQSIQNIYDNQTRHGADGDAQRFWVRSWKTVVDDVLSENGWLP